MTEDATHPASCSSCHTKGNFNYCFWAKLIVAVPVLPLIAIVSASMFHGLLMQMVAAGISVFASVWLAVVIDRLPVFSGMVVKRKA